jgi:ubiquinone biosynthesis protein Coq4
MSAVGVVTVNVKYGDVEETFIGNVNDVWLSVTKFFSEFIPAFDIAQKVTLKVDLAKLVEDIKDLISIAPEGPILLVSREKLADSESLQLHLLATYLGYRLGKLTRDTMTKEELQFRLGKNIKITSTRLGELTKDGLTTKTEEGSYKITTIGIKKLQEETLPKIRAKLKT